MEFVCKFCGRRKGDAKGWLLGFENVSPTWKRNTIILLRGWDEQRAGESTAVHFCSTACQDKYVSENYGDETLVA
jgi:hypothetical protein